MLTDKQLLNNAFRELRKQGYFARQNFYYWRKWREIPEANKGLTKYVFYHHQDNKKIKNGFIEKGGMYVAWSGDGNQIVDIISQTALRAYWNGDKDKRILILSSTTTPDEYAEITKKKA